MSIDATILKNYVYINTNNALLQWVKLNAINTTKYQIYNQKPNFIAMC